MERSWEDIVYTKEEKVKQLYTFCELTGLINPDCFVQNMVINQMSTEEFIEVFTNKLLKEKEDKYFKMIYREVVDRMHSGQIWLSPEYLQYPLVVLGYNI